MTDREQMQVFSRNLNNLIHESGKTQRQVAEDLGVLPTTFNTWCVGKILPRAGKIRAIADYFGVPMTALTDPPTLKPVHSFSQDELNVMLAYRMASDGRRDAVRALLGLCEE